MNAGKKQFIKCVLYGVITGSLVASMVSFAGNALKSRHVFYFNSFDTDKICTESRYSPVSLNEYSPENFISDLLLGPMTNRYRNLFCKGMKLGYCIEKNKCLYVGLVSPEGSTGEENVDYRADVDLLCLNIVKNFSNINSINIYIDGELVEKQ